MKTLQEIRVRDSNVGLWEIEISEKQGGGHESILYKVGNDGIPEQIPRAHNFYGNTPNVVFENEIQDLLKKLGKEGLHIVEIDNICEAVFISVSEQILIVNKLGLNIPVKHNGK